MTQLTGMIALCSLVQCHWLTLKFQSLHQNMATHQENLEQIKSVMNELCASQHVSQY